LPYTTFTFASTSTGLGQTRDMSKISIAHFNDVYRVTPQKFSNTSSETIDVTKFGGLVDSVRAQWGNRSDGKKDGLTLFSGDAFSPSVESSVTRGSHMVSRSTSCALTTNI
jgi:hypothetical protein